MTFQTRAEAIQYFLEFQKRILEKEAETKEKLREIQTPLKDLVEQYKKEQREVFGFADGDPAGLVQWLEAIGRFEK